MQQTKLIYLHGFNSSPDSFKARALQAYFDEKYPGSKFGAEFILEIPAVPPVPDEAIELLVRRVESAMMKSNVALAGSSLGGFYATWLAERYGLKAVLINPAVKPHALLQKYLGENINYYTSQRWMLNESHIEQLRKLEIDVTRPERYFLMLQTGDETLDYRQAEEKYKGSASLIEEGGSHAFDNFEAHIEVILDFISI